MSSFLNPTNDDDLPGGGPSHPARPPDPPLPPPPPAPPPDQPLLLLHAPLSELKPAGPEPGEIEVLAALPEAKRLKLAYAFHATAPFTNPDPSVAIAAVRVTVEMLSALGRQVARRPGITLTALRFAAALSVIDLRYPDAPSHDAGIFLSPTVLQLEGATLLPVWRARSAGTSEEIILWAAETVLELWELAARLRRWPEKSAAELSRSLGRLSGKPKEILRQVALFHAADEVAERFTAWRFGSQATGGSGK